MTALATCLRDKKLRKNLEGDFQSEYQLDIARMRTGELCIFRAARLLSVLPRHSRLYRINHGGEKEFSFVENLLIGILDFLKTDAYYNMVGASAAVSDKKVWKQVAAGAPKSILDTTDETPQKKSGTSFGYGGSDIHPRNALQAVRRIVRSQVISQMAEDIRKPSGG